ncbi:MAG: helix-turn-helix domain-containing protein [Oscillospiraceae bacterium]|jgi:transcriptional regulator with XRE-family HTH domain|nr:helix-turn-helix domain-containing protein [Oscillospiraceae bacterium]
MMTKNEIMSLMGQNLRKCRTERNLTQEAVAFKANISVSHYAALENGRKSMSMLVFRQLADALEVSADFLLRTPDTVHQIKSVNLLLANQPIKVVDFIEKIIRLCITEYSAK